MAITDNLISYWELEEASGTRNDSCGTNHLADNNTVTQAAGKVGNAALFTKANNEFLSIASNTTLNMGDIDFTIVLWVWFTTVGGAGLAPVMVSKALGPSNSSYYVYYDVNSAHFRMALSPDGTDAALVDFPDTNSGAASASTWYFVAAQYDATANLAYLSVNNGTQTTQAETGGAFSSTASFRMSNLADDPNLYVDGLIDQVGLWKRKLSATELTYLYNSGNGRSYRELTGFHRRFTVTSSRTVQRRSINMAV